MYMLISAVTALFSLGLVVIPLFLLLHFTAKNRFKKRDFLLSAVFACLIAGIFTVTGIPSMYSLMSGSCDAALNLIPFAEVLTSPLQYILNVILFLPLGLLLPLMHPAFRQLKYSAFFGFFLSLFIEIMQLFNFRTTDINDLIANTLGAALGFAVISFLSDGFKGKSSLFLRWLYRPLQAAFIQCSPAITGRNSILAAHLSAAQFPGPAFPAAFS